MSLSPGITYSICLVDRRYRPVTRLIGLQSAQLFRLADKNIELGTHIRWFLSYDGAVTNSDYEKMSLFIEERGVFLRLVTPRLRVDLFFLVVRLRFFYLRATRDVDRRLRLRPRPVNLLPRF